MESAQFDQFRAGLAAAGFSERSAHRDERAFGSWFVELHGEPPLRVVWDGRDGWLMVRS